ncbi:hypothetical protein L210DRAFT_3568749 [Boletus edulis BED1]|uniref:Uncharacterized protein n=1 Tax=Boletus edulis BED1 TaxID=1328754 RepID=A0AAD4BEJ2_BOLED|nr:hypothetical protein L210DRAFT_3568749 [Boletus edulis BED1]
MLVHKDKTITKAIVDIASPPTGQITPFNIYVALSHFLRKEDERLAKLNQDTFTKWKEIL